MSYARTFEKTILITGAAGFIGSNLVSHVYRRYPNYRLVLLDALTYAGSLENLPAEFNRPDSDQISFWYGNVCNAELVDTLVSQSTIVVHFAAETHVTRSIYDNFVFFQTDVIGTQTIMNSILKHCKHIERVIHISTSEVYGTAVTPLMTEEHPLNPMSPYASAKCGADRLVYSYWSTYNLPTVIVRPFNNYGPRQHLEKVIPRFITSVLLNENLTVHGDGDAERDFIHVDDTVRAIDLIMHAPDNLVIGEVFNVASGQDRAIRSIACDVLCAMNGDAQRIAHIGDRPGQVARHAGDWSKINSRLGWKPETEWESGLQDTIMWYRANEQWWRRQIWMRHIKIKTAHGTIENH